MSPESRFNIAVSELAPLFACQLVLVQCNGFQTCWAAVQYFRNAIFIPPPTSSGTSVCFEHLAPVQGRSAYTLDRVASQPGEVPASRVKSAALIKNV